MDLKPARVSKSRRDTLYSILDRFTVTTAQIVRYFPGRTLSTRLKTANRWLRRQRKRNKARVIGIVQLKETGRPVHAYGRRCAADEIEHELFVSEIAFHFGLAQAWRGEVVHRANPDLLLRIDGKRCYVEVDNSQKMTARQMQDKWDRYGTLSDDEFILVICHTVGRMERLRAKAETVKDWALFTTFDRLRAGEPWVDYIGTTVLV
jgi:hypothetical protein